MKFPTLEGGRHSKILHGDNCKRSMEEEDPGKPKEKIG
jgi:hypothetical protein